MPAECTAQHTILVPPRGSLRIYLLLEYVLLLVSSCQLRSLQFVLFNTSFNRECHHSDLDKLDTSDPDDREFYIGSFLTFVLQMPITTARIQSESIRPRVFSMPLPDRHGLAIGAGFLLQTGRFCLDPVQPWLGGNRLRCMHCHHRFQSYLHEASDFLVQTA